MSDGTSVSQRAQSFSLRLKHDGALDELSARGQGHDDFKAVKIKWFTRKHLLPACARACLSVCVFACVSEREIKLLQAEKIPNIIISTFQHSMSSAARMQGKTCTHARARTQTHTYAHRCPVLSRVCSGDNYV